MSKPSRYAWMLAAAALLSVALPAPAQDRAAREHEALRRAQQALREAQQSNLNLQQEADLAQSQLQQSKALLLSEQDKNKSAAAHTASLAVKLKSALSERETLSADLAKAKEEIAALQHELQDNKDQLARRTAQLVQLNRSFRLSRDEVQSCEGKNITLYNYSVQLLDLYEKKGVVASLVQEEPLSGIAQVQYENLRQEYRDKLEQQRVAGQAPIAPGQAATASSGLTP